MPSVIPSVHGRSTRRRVIAAVGTAVTAGLAGCSGQIPGTAPEQIDTETTVEDGRDPRILWRYPRREGEKDGIGYAAVEIDRIVQQDSPDTAIHLAFNSTVGSLAADEPYEGYQPDWFRFRIWPPASYDGRINHRVRVEPPGQWEDFSAYYDIQGNVRRTTVELRNVSTEGTIEIPAVFDPGPDSLPDRLHCSFTVQASRSGFLGKTVRVTDQNSLPLERR